MKYSRKWLHQQLNSSASFSDLLEQIRKAGFEVKLLSSENFDFSGIVIGEILSILPHPNADKLQICMVSVGGEEPLTIVCGASNIFASMIVPVAIIGAILPGNFKIKKAKLRGETSCGMICSSKELALSTSSKGILALPENAPIGKDVFEYLNLKDEMIEITDPTKEAEELSVGDILEKLKLSGLAENKPLKINKLKKLLKVLFKL